MTQKEQLTLNDKIKFDNKGGAILGVLEGPVADFQHPTRNGRLYSEQLWENVLKNPLVQEQFKNGGIVGELDHPADREDICTEKVAIIMPEPPVKKNGQYIGKFNILDTPCGRIVYTLAKAGFKLGVSSRGTGDVDDYTDEVDPNSYEFTCFDVVLLPAVESARMNLVTESLDTSKKPDYKELLKEDINKASDSDKKVMNETLKHIGIDLTESEKKKEEKPEEEVKVEETKVEEPVEKESEGEQSKEETVSVEEVVPEETVEDAPLPEDRPRNSILSSDTLDDIGLEDTEEDCVEDAKLVELLHRFLEVEGLALDGGSDEEKYFVDLFHEIVCPEVTNEPEKGVDINNEGAPKEPEVGDTESTEILEQLQKVLKENGSLKTEVKNLQSEKAVSGAKVSKLNEELNTFKAVAVDAGKKVIDMKSLETKNDTLSKENASLKEELEKGTKKTQLQESRISFLLKAKTDLENKTNIAKEENKKLKEQLNNIKNDSDKKLTEANATITKAKKLLEQYKQLAYKNANRYIEMKARGLGVSKNEILNKLNESYTLDDVDNVCNDLQEYSLNLGSLPFAFNKSSNAKVRIREDHSRDPLRGVDNQYDDEVDDFLLDLAGIERQR